MYLSSRKFSSNTPTVVLSCANGNRCYRHTHGSLGFKLAGECCFPLSTLACRPRRSCHIRLHDTNGAIIISSNTFGSSGSDIRNSGVIDLMLFDATLVRVNLPVALTSPQLGFFFALPVRLGVVLDPVIISRDGEGSGRARPFAANWKQLLSGSNVHSHVPSDRFLLFSER
jgi:hypothetical protein